MDFVFILRFFFVLASQLSTEAEKGTNIKDKVKGAHCKRITKRIVGEKKSGFYANELVHANYLIGCSGILPYTAESLA